MEGRRRKEGKGGEKKGERADPPKI